MPTPRVITARIDDHIPVYIDVIHVINRISINPIAVVAIIVYINITAIDIINAVINLIAIDIINPVINLIAINIINSVCRLRPIHIIGSILNLCSINSVCATTFSIHIHAGTISRTASISGSVCS